MCYSNKISFAKTVVRGERVFLILFFPDSHAISPTSAINFGSDARYLNQLLDIKKRFLLPRKIYYMLKLRIVFIVTGELILNYSIRLTSRIRFSNLKFTFRLRCFPKIIRIAFRLIWYCFYVIYYVSDIRNE